MTDARALSGSALIIEDDADVAFLMATHLGKLGFEVSIEHGGHAGLETATSTPPDLIVLDLRMQPVSGLEVLDALQDDSRTTDVPVIVVSVLELADEVRKAGAKAFLLKPFEPEAFVDTVRDVAGL